MTADNQTTEGPATTYAECGPVKSKCEHVWNGPFRAFPDGNGGEATCSKCGAGAFNAWNIWS
jgi:hypothetical protein